MLVDARAAYETLVAADQAALGRVELFEHNVFDGDRDRHRLVVVDQGAPRIYYSYWLCDADALGDAEAAALLAFRRALKAAPVYRRRLLPGEVLIVDNTRMLHGRTAFDDPDRHLRRFWIEEVE